jgi:8-oxo-dGTP pyrophosphatase MutT (NUDIX family)
VFVFDEEGKIGLIADKHDRETLLLPGGGVDKGETWRDCAARECLEEIGVVVEEGSLKSVGFYDGYGVRRVFKTNSEVWCHWSMQYFVAQAQTKVSPTTVQKNELDLERAWMSPREYLVYLEGVLKKVPIKILATLKNGF